MTNDERARSILTALEEKQLAILQRFEEEQLRLQEMLERKQALLDEKQQQVLAKVQREQERLQAKLAAAPEDERTGRDRILDTATTMFMERGYLDVSMREIAEAAGLRKATIYHHFRAKDDLFVAVTLRMMQRQRLAMEQALSQPLPLPAQLERLANMQLEHWQSSMTRIVQDFQEHIPESKHDEIHKELFATMDIYVQVFADGVERGEITALSPHLAGAAFFHLVSAWTWDPFGSLKGHLPPPNEVAKLAVRTLLYGIAGPALQPDQPPH
ncbi:MAG TPA: TetR family transcriptional regulator [Thermomicrobiales bacterium]|nr:TetR family transcriptional regulator [Thermomicrobiales bacterium]